VTGTYASGAVVEGSAGGFGGSRPMPGVVEPGDEVLHRADLGDPLVDSALVVAGQEVAAVDRRAAVAGAYPAAPGLEGDGEAGEAVSIPRPKALPIHQLPDGCNNPAQQRCCACAGQVLAPPQREQRRCGSDEQDHIEGF
jgi:hypothetical protein